jgi:hypothetical protein
VGALVAPVAERDSVGHVVATIRVCRPMQYMMSLYQLLVRRPFAAILAGVSVAPLYGPSPIQALDVSALLNSAFPVVVRRSAQFWVPVQCLGKFFPMLCGLWLADLCCRNLGAVVGGERGPSPVVSVDVVHRPSGPTVASGIGLSRNYGLLSTSALAQAVSGRHSVRDRFSDVVVPAPVFRLVVAIPRTLIKVLTTSARAKHTPFYIMAAA